MMHFIIGNYGNETIALLSWAKANNLSDLYCLYVDTGWAAPSWGERVHAAESWVRSLGFTPLTLKSQLDFAEMVRSRGEFPNRKFQWCASTLKGLTLLDYLEVQDPLREGIIMLPHRRSLSPKLQDLPEWVEESEYYAGRKLWYPLYLHDEALVQARVAATPFPWLLHRSLECDPCVNSDKCDLLRGEAKVSTKAAALERELGMPMLDASMYQQGEDIFSLWQRLGKEQSCPHQNKYLFDQSCASPFACGL